jgi:soluble lytic murein transglycosylase-like protein
MASRVLEHRYRYYSLSCLLVAWLVVAAAGVAHAQQAPDPELREALQKAVNESGSFRDRFDAEVWLMDMSGRLSRRLPSTPQRLELLKLVHYEATRVALPPELVLAVIEVESNFDRWAISRVGAQGLMQIMPFWLKEIGRPDDNLFRPETNVRMGCTILRHYLDREKGNLQRALARYNGSLGRTIYPDKVFNALRVRWYKN